MSCLRSILEERFPSTIELHSAPFGVTEALPALQEGAVWRGLGVLSS